MRVLLDTNILVRAAGGLFGPAAELLARLDPSHTLIISQPLLIELSRVLHYEHVRKLHQLDDSAIEEFLLELYSLAKLVNPSSMPTVTSDPDDDLVIATAIAGQAEVLCTLDRHIRHPDVREYCARHGIRVLTDSGLLAILRKE